MARCIELAKNGLGTTYPNPLVGCVIVCKDTIIGEGWHKKSGEAHAEVIAVNSVADKSLLTKSTIYVSLEPCSHFGKTPPCADLIMKHNIPQVVVGTVDPNKIVAGNGIQKLKDAGIDVTVGILENECAELNKRFFTYHQKARPYVFLKWAESADGFLSPREKNTREPAYITNKFSRQLVHKWRSEEHAILIGAQTAVDDNPRLDVREWSGNNPVRILIDKTGRVSAESHIFDNQSKTIVISGNLRSSENESVIYEMIDFSANVPQQVLDVLHRHKILSVIVEGGTRTLQGFIDAGLWDEAYIFIGSPTFSGGTPRPIFTGKPMHEQRLLDDKLLMFRNND
jgi:diaminohydroxyphosphoribosylaminopyrimidine deaminase/5-amino-6-(5-phosphoribosylamino)uracil reductase